MAEDRQACFVRDSGASSKSPVSVDPPKDGWLDSSTSAGCKSRGIPKETGGLHENVTCGSRHIPNSSDSQRK